MLGIGNCLKFINLVSLMPVMNEFLATTPFDLYELSLFNLVAETGSFTRAGQRAGLGQSAITRQIRGLEEALGVALFERTTRHVSLTPAGTLLRAKAEIILGSVNEALRHLRSDFQLTPPVLKIGVSRSIGLAPLPGFFTAFQRKFPAVQLHVTHAASRAILDAVEAKTLDAGLLCPPPRLARGLQITHRFADEFVLIAPPDFPVPARPKKVTPGALAKILGARRWLFIDRESNTGKRQHQWLREHGLRVEPAMELDSFDLIVNLVSLGLGVSLVPRRVLPLYAGRREVRQIPLKPVFQRDLVVVVRKNRELPEPLRQFVANILFSPAKRGRTSR